VGTSIIKVVAVEQSGSAQSAEAARQQMADAAADAKRTSHVRTMTGNIAEVPAPDLLQLFGASKKSGVLVIRSGNNVGQIFLANGLIEFAVVNDDFAADPRK